MIFAARLFQEKCQEQHRDLFLAFADLTKAFDTANRQLSWSVLSKFGCPTQFLAVLHEYHEGMTTRVQVGGQESEPFFVTVGVKQGCDLAPVIFNLFRVAIALVFHHGISEDNAIAINYRHDSTFDVCSPQPKPPKTFSLSCNMQTMRRCQVTQLTAFKETG